MSGFVILFFGPPLSGKGTQSKLLAEHLSVPVLSSGDLLRSEIADKTELGLKIEAYVNSGQLVPNVLLYELFHQHISKHTNGLILDGFVREPENNDLVSSVCESLGLTIICLVNLVVPYPILQHRLVDRQKISNRIDDDADILERRYAVYTKHSAAITELYKATDRLVDVACQGGIDNTQLVIRWRLAKYLRPRNMFLLKHLLLVTAAGGRIEDSVYVTQPGVLLISDAGVECDSNLVTFLIAGCSAEAVIELCAHGEASVARLTTSKTKAMCETLYRVYSDAHDQPIDTTWQKQMIQSILELRQQFSEHGGDQSTEVFNMLNLGTKCLSLCYSMSLAGLNKLFIGRTQEPGNESEIRAIVKEMIAVLHPIYPQIIRSYADYSNMSNADKYSKAPAIPAPQGLYETKLTSAAKYLFSLLNINAEQPEYLQLAEFRSRLTYLAFVTSTPSIDATMRYHEKIICFFKHLSVLGAYQVIEDGVATSFKKIFEQHI